MSNRAMQTLGSALLASILLAACGGSDDDEPVVVTPPPPVANMVPSSALASSTAYTQFAVTQSGSTSESDEPLGASNVDVPPSSETDEPVAVS